jgi:hypothetical protein
MCHFNFSLDRKSDVYITRITLVIKSIFVNQSNNSIYDGVWISFFVIVLSFLH